MRYLTTILIILSAVLFVDAVEQVTPQTISNNWLPSIKQFHQTYSANDVTSSRSNAPEFIMECVNKNDNFGIYQLIDISLKQNPPIMGRLFVSFDTNVWQLNDTTQKVIVYQELYRPSKKLLNIDLSVGDPIEKADKLFGNPILIEDNLRYHTTNGYGLVVKASNSLISQFLIWNCSIKDTEQIDNLVEKYLIDQ